MASPKPKKQRTRYVYRSAKTGNFVTRAYAEAHPKTTLKQRLRIGGCCK